MDDSNKKPLGFKKLKAKLVSKNEEVGLDEAGMPASVIKNKQAIADMSDAEFAKRHGNKSEKELRDMAARHGFGFNKATGGSDHYVKRVASGKTKNEEVKLTESSSTFKAMKSKMEAAAPMPGARATLPARRGRVVHGQGAPVKLASPRNEETELAEGTIQMIKHFGGKYNDPNRAEVHRITTGQTMKAGESKFTKDPETYRVKHFSDGKHLKNKDFNTPSKEKAFAKATSHVNEEVELDEAARGRPRKVRPGEKQDVPHMMTQLEKHVRNAEMNPLKFENGQTAKVPEGLAMKAMKIHDSLDRPSKKAAYITHITKSLDHFKSGIKANGNVEAPKKNKITLAGPQMKKEDYAPLKHPDEATQKSKGKAKSGDKPEKMKDPMAGKYTKEEIQFYEELSDSNKEVFRTLSREEISEILEAYRNQ